MTMPTWLQTQLVADGVMTETFITRKIKPRRCRTCRALCLAAIDDLGLEAWTDPTELTAEGEFLALLAGRRTWLILGTDLVDRGPEDIAYRPADAWRVVAAHACGAPPLPAKPAKNHRAIDYDKDPIPF